MAVSALEAISLSRAPVVYMTMWVTLGYSLLQLGDPSQYLGLNIVSLLAVLSVSGSEEKASLRKDGNCWGDAPSDRAAGWPFLGLLKRFQAVPSSLGVNKDDVQDGFHGPVLKPEQCHAAQ